MDFGKIIEFLETTFQVGNIQDFPNAFNGLQLANNGTVHKIIGAVDASRISIEKAIEEQAQLLIVHHGLLWNGAQPIVGPLYELYKKGIISKEVALEHSDNANELTHYMRGVYSGSGKMDF